MRVRAPRLRGRGWLNVPASGPPDLHGRFVLLDFWTSACINCVHVIEELRPLQQRYRDRLTVIGVHSPKFPYEATPSALAAAVQRYRVEHPVLDDPELANWDSYAVNAWPTLILVDPAGYVVAHVSGEGHVAELAGLIDELSVAHRDDLRTDTARPGRAQHRPTLLADLRNTGRSADVSPGAEVVGGCPVGLPGWAEDPYPFADLRFPGGLLRLPPAPDRPHGSILLSDTGHHRILRIDTGPHVGPHIGPDISSAGPPVPDPAVTGCSRRGLSDGSAATARLAEPLGLAALPREVADRLGYDVLVADSGNDAVRGLRSGDSGVVTVATGLSSPAAVAWFEDRIVVAVTGRHQLWQIDPFTAAVHPFAGTGREGLVDGPAARAWFAQPSGLAVGPAGLWVVDAESSALRLVHRADDDGSLQVRTVVGQGLFDFGPDDGDAWVARLQHPLGVFAAADGTVLVADTFNGSLRRYDPATDRVDTLLDGLAEPAAVIAETDSATTLLVAEAAGHRVRRIRIGSAQDGGVRSGVVLDPVGPFGRGPAPISGLGPDQGPDQGPDPGQGPGSGPDPGSGPVRVAVRDLDGRGSVTLTVRFVPPPGQIADLRSGEQTWLEVTARPADLLIAGAAPAPGLRRELRFVDRISGGRVDGVLRIEARAASCDATGADPLCRLHRRRWEVPVRLIPGAATALELRLGD